MPDLNDATRKSITVQGLLLSAPQPYDEGHELTANEAGALNQTFLENLRNNYAAKIKKFCEDAGAEDSTALTPTQHAEIQADFDGYCEGYEFGVRGGRESDPVRAQAIQLAMERVRAALKAKGHKLSDVGPEKIRDLAENAVNTNSAFMEKAAEIVAARAGAADALSVEL